MTRRSGYKVRLTLAGELGTDGSFTYWGDRLPHIGQVIEVSSEYHSGAKEARVDRLSPDDDCEIHATELEP